MDGRSFGAPVVTAWGQSSQPGIESRHWFSSGPFYDPARVAFGPVVGVDDHRVAPGAGFDWHAHRGVHIVSWVLDGSLLHSGASEPVVVGPGRLFVQSTGSGVRHREWNASDDVRLRFVQITVLADGDVGTWFADAPATVAGVRISVSSSTVVLSVDQDVLDVQLEKET